MKPDASKLIQHENTKYWIGVVSEDHVRIGQREGIAQLGHGKSNPLARMKQGDYLIYYSPYLTLEDKAPFRKFSALGRIMSESPYRDKGGDGFKPFKVDMEYLPGTDVEVEPLIDALSFIKSKMHWGYPFRAGHFEISKADFDLIAALMLDR
jgi:predicted RNA-binding protein